MFVKPAFLARLVLGLHHPDPFIFDGNSRLLGEGGYGDEESWKRRSHAGIISKPAAARHAIFRTCMRHTLANRWNAVAVWGRITKPASPNAAQAR